MKDDLQSYFDLILEPGVEKPEQSDSSAQQKVDQNNELLTKQTKHEPSRMERSKTKESADDREFKEVFEKPLSSTLTQDLVRKRIQNLALQTKRKHKQAQAKQALAQKTELKVKTKQKTPPAPKVETTVTVKEQLAIKEQPADKVDVVVAEDKTPQRPSWVKEQFDCLFFKVSGLTLAVPLVELGSVYPITEQFTPMFAKTDWFLGLLPTNERQIKAVNTAKVVLPERYDGSSLDKLRYVISIHGYDWGLAVDEVEEAVRLESSSVKWRAERSKRPWLAGTVVEHMCAILDLKSLAIMLESPQQVRD